MSSILICSTPAIGHIVPLTNVVRSLVAAGDRVRFITGEQFREVVEQAGAEFIPLPGEMVLDSDALAELYPERAGLTGPAAIRFDIINLFIKPIEVQWSTVEAALAAEKTDAVLAETMFTGLAPLLYRDRADRPLVVNLGIVPLSLRSKDTAPFGLGVAPMAGPIGRLRDRILRLVADRAIFAPVEKAARDAVGGIVGRPVTETFMDWPARADLVTQFSVAGFDYPRSDLPETVRFVGPVSRGGGRTVDRPDWWGDLDGARKVVHVTQGTVANTDLSQLVLPAIEGLANDDDVLVVVTTGGRPLDSLPGNLPANVRVAEYLPYDDLIPRVDAFVTNGGYGGVHFALQNGVPLVVAGLTEDKTEVNARVGWSGAGINLRSNSPKPAAVRQAVRRVLDDPRYRAASERLGREIAASPGPDAVPELLRELLPAAG